MKGGGDGSDVRRLDRQQRLSLTRVVQFSFSLGLVF